MALKTIFPEEMMTPSSSGSSFTLESIAGKLTYFQEQLHLIHWQTSVYAEHVAIGDLYSFVHDFKDDFIEKMMGYTGKKPKAFKIEPVKDGIVAKSLVKELETYAHQVYEWAESMEYCDLENMAQDLSGKAAKTSYLLTLS